MNMVRISGYLLLIVGITVGSLLLLAALGGAKVPAAVVLVVTVLLGAGWRMKNAETGAAQRTLSAIPRRFRYPRGLTVVIRWS